MKGKVISVNYITIEPMKYMRTKKNLKFVTPKDPRLKTNFYISHANVIAVKLFF